MTKDLFNPIQLGNLFSLFNIQAEADYVSGSDCRFKEFTEFTLGIDIVGGEELSLISFNREQYDGDTWADNYKIDQLTGCIEESDLREIIAANIEKIEEAINEFIDDHENQNMN